MKFFLKSLALVIGIIVIGILLLSDIQQSYERGLYCPLPL